MQIMGVKWGKGGRGEGGEKAWAGMCAVGLGMGDGGSRLLQAAGSWQEDNNKIIIIIMMQAQGKKEGRRKRERVSGTRRFIGTHTHTLGTCILFDFILLIYMFYLHDLVFFLHGRSIRQRNDDQRRIK